MAHFWGYIFHKACVENSSSVDHLRAELKRAQFEESGLMVTVIF